MQEIFPYILFVALGFLSGCLNVPALNDSKPRVQVWIDSDAYIGTKDRSVDSAWAMVQAFNSIEIQPVGISAVFGSSPLSRTNVTTGEITGLFGPSNLTVYQGASGPTDLGHETNASRALAQALRYQRLTILALGPLTTIATVLRNHPELQSQVVQIIAVAGRRPGQHFTIGTTNPKPLRDLKFDLDPDAFGVLLYATQVPLTLIPFEIGSKVLITEDDIKHLQQGKEAARYLYPSSQGWLTLWQKVYNVQGFNPFSTLAVGYLTTPSFLRCEELPAQISLLPDDTLLQTAPGMAAPKKPYLLVSQSFKGTRNVRYCDAVAHNFKSSLMHRVLGGSDVQFYEAPDPF